VLQNDNSDIWKPLKIPDWFSGFTQRCIGTKYHLIETQKKESGFLLYTIDQLKIKLSAPHHHSLKKFFHLTGRKIIDSLPAVVLFSLNKHLRLVALTAKTKTNKHDS
jgi:hypothetical protein